MIEKFRSLDLLRWMRHNLIPSRQNGWKLFNRGQLLYLEYGIDPQPRYGHGQPPHPGLYEIINSRRTHYFETLASFTPYLTRLAQIDTSKETTSKATFRSRYYTGLDAIALYSFMRLHKPRHYIEIGSGNSTHFARLAVSDGKLQDHTTITCIDAEPRQEIDDIADRVMNTYLENADLSIFTTLEAGDIVFLDGSHRAFTNSDVTIFFLDILPNLAPGVLVHIHDIYLPEDYPPIWNRRYYSEQYLLACYLLAHTGLFDVLLPAHFLSVDAEAQDWVVTHYLKHKVNHLPKNGTSFWLLRK